MAAKINIIIEISMWHGVVSIIEIVAKMAAYQRERRNINIENMAHQLMKICIS
jgi:hypothetical protein